MMILILIYRDGREERKQIVSPGDIQAALKIMQNFRENTELVLVTFETDTT